MNTGSLGYIEHRSTTYPPQCFRCKHYLGDRTCKAFPDKNIPREFLTEKVKHRIVLGNQFKDFIYSAKEKFIEKDKQFEEIEIKAISELEKNKESLPLAIIKMITEEGGDLDSIEKLVIEAKGRLRNRFQFYVKFFPKEEARNIEILKYECVGIANKILRAYEGLNLESKFTLTIFKGGEYNYK